MSAAAEAARAALAPDASADDWIDPPTLLDADQALELVGEDLRGRLLFVTGPDGRERCLRPDMTLPVAISYLAGWAHGPAPARAFLYDGRIYRAPAAGRAEIESRSVGVERFADADAAAADADMLGLCLDAAARAGVRDVSVKLNDLGLFSAALEALDLAEPWRSRLQAAVGRPRALKALIDAPVRLSQGDPARALVGLPPEEAFARAQAIVDALPGSAAGRGREAIARRLAAKAAFAADPDPPAAARRLLGALFDIKGGPEKVLDKRRKATADIGLNLDDFFERAAARLAAVRARVGEKAELFADPVFQGNFWFYDGFLFSVRSRRVERGGVVAAGGRYDGLIGRLAGGARHAPAVGCSLQPDALLAAAEAEA